MPSSARRRDTLARHLLVALWEAVEATVAHLCLDEAALWSRDLLAPHWVALCSRRVLTTLATDGGPLLDQRAPSLLALRATSSLILLLLVRLEVSELVLD
jgi:hypothetical protein